jgi:hypothetical protein
MPEQIRHGYDSMTCRYARHCQLSTIKLFQANLSSTEYFHVTKISIASTKVLPRCFPSGNTT